jgi:hypothetical protein
MKYNKLSIIEPSYGISSCIRYDRFTDYKAILIYNAVSKAEINSN